MIINLVLFVVLCIAAVFFGRSYLFKVNSSLDESLRASDSLFEGRRNVHVHEDIIKKFMFEKQQFFCDVYLKIIFQHQKGISTIDLKRKSREYIIRNFGFDPFDPSISGYSKSQGVARAEQWASNVISNRLLDDRPDINIVRNSKKDVWVYPVGIK